MVVLLWPIFYLFWLINVRENFALTQQFDHTVLLHIFIIIYKLHYICFSDCLSDFPRPGGERGIREI